MVNIIKRTDIMVCSANVTWEETKMDGMLRTNEIPIDINMAEYRAVHILHDRYQGVYNIDNNTIAFLSYSDADSEIYFGLKLIK